jgi:hypothetical protein
MTLPRRLHVLSLLLMFLLVAGPLAAATSGHRSRGAGPSGLSITGALSEAWAFVSRIWMKAGGSSDPFGKAGSGIDPFGNPAPSTLAPSHGSPTESQPTPGQ